MKKLISTTLLLSLSLALSLNVAHAESFGSLSYGSRAKVVDETIVNNSLLELSGVVSTDVKWIMINIVKNDFHEQLLLAVENGSYKTRISLQNGAGLYEIGLYTTSSADRYKNYITYKNFIVENTDLRDMSFLLPTFKVQIDDYRIKSLVARLTKHARDDQEAFLAIYK